MNPRREWNENGAWRHSFWIQALLIILPATVLAWAGIKAVREDRIAADRKLLNEAARWSRESSGFIVEPWIQNLQRNFANGFERKMNEWGFADDRKFLKCKVTESGELLHPPPLMPLQPADEPNAAFLESRLEVKWRRWLTLLNPASGQSSLEIHDTYSALKESELPSEFQSALWMDYAKHLLRRDPKGEALSVIEEGLAEHGATLTETGTPMGLIASLLYFRHLDFDQPIPGEPTKTARIACELLKTRPTLLNRFWFEQILDAITARGRQPPPISDSNFKGKDAPHSLDEFHEAISLFEAAFQEWNDQQFLRELHSLFRKKTKGPSIPEYSAILELEGERFLCWERPMEGLFAGIRLEAAAPLFEKIESTELPSYLGLCLYADDFPLIECASGDSLSRHLAAAPDWMPRFQTAIHLIDRGEYYAAIESRARRFSALIGFSCLAVALGLTTLWRGHRRQLQLSAMKSNFVASVSHELRAPIASLRLMAEELADDASLSSDRARTYHRLIGNDAKRLSHLVENVLDLSRIERGIKRYEKEPCDLAALTRETCELMKPIASDKRIAIEFDAETGEAEIEMESLSVQRAVINLLDNAVKFAPVQSKISVSLNRQGDEMRLTIRDEGPGIPEQERDSVFQPFYRVGDEHRRETQGVGLGLALVKHVVEGHGGSVTFENIKEGGCSFVLRLPIT